VRRIAGGITVTTSDIVTELEKLWNSNVSSKDTVSALFTLVRAFDNKTKIILAEEELTGADELIEILEGIGRFLETGVHSDLHDVAVKFLSLDTY
jgi:hypothetical protein